MAKTSLAPKPARTKRPKELGQQPRAASASQSWSLCTPRAREAAEGLGPSPDPGLLLDDQTSLFDAVNLIRRRVNFGAFDSLFDFAGLDSFAFRQPTPAGHTLSATPATFSPYVGTSTVPLGVVGIMGTSFGNPPDLRVRINGDELIGSVTFRYDFTAVAVPPPEYAHAFQRRDTPLVGRHQISAS